ncbi:M28 family peptidase [Streptosporangium sp. NPDC000239]|uniref:M28 family peptidase n=1 Tax=Streptosporangium sp. NPDC000239 TaxID=3154248 RepID=UPI00331DAD07
MTADRLPDGWRRRTCDEVIRAYAGIARLPTSPGEKRVAAALAERLRGLGYRAGVEPVRATSSYALPIGLLSAAGLAAGLLSRYGTRPSPHGGGSYGGARRAAARWGAAVVAAAASAAIADDVAGGARWFRRVALPHRRAHNVVAYGGDPTANRTVVVLAHHDAAPSGVIFDQRVLRWVARHFPAVIAAAKENPPTWWPVILGPALVAVGAASGDRRLGGLGTAITAANLAFLADIGRRPAVPGANDNLSGVAALVCVARALQREPVSGLRVVLLSAGAEEALQEGIRGFARRHFPDLGPGTCFVNLESVGSGRLALLEGEGPVLMRDYPEPFRRFVAECARDIGVPLLRGLRSRNSTDSEVPRRHGYPVATIVSLDHDKLITHYHLDSDVPDNVDLDSVVSAAELAEAVIRRLAREEPAP